MYCTMLFYFHSYNLYSLTIRLLMGNFRNIFQCIVIMISGSFIDLQQEGFIENVPSSCKSDYKQILIYLLGQHRPKMIGKSIQGYIEWARTWGGPLNIGIDMKLIQIDQLYTCVEKSNLKDQFSRHLLNWPISWTCNYQICGIWPESQGERTL